MTTDKQPEVLCTVEALRLADALNRAAIAKAPVAQVRSAEKPHKGASNE